MNTHINLDRVIDDAISLADLHGPQTGTAPRPRPVREFAPVDSPPVEFAGEEDDRGPVSPAQARELLGEFFDEFPKDLLAAMAIEHIVRKRSATIEVLLGEWGNAYGRGLVTQPMGPQAFARFAADEFETGYQSGHDEAVRKGAAR